MITVQSVIDTKSKELFDMCKTLQFVLYKNESFKYEHSVADFSESIVVYEQLLPIAYSSDKKELEDYAKRNSIVNPIITDNPFL